MNSDRYCATEAQHHSPNLLAFDEGWSCWRHMSTEQRDRVEAAEESARGRLGEYGWPYGANISVPTRERLAAWLGEHDLRRSSGAECLHWLHRGRCSQAMCVGRDYRWMDHSSSWLSDTHRVLVSHPYHLVDGQRAELEALGEQHSDWTVDITQHGWYGHGTWQITLWAPRT